MSEQHRVGSIEADQAASGIDDGSGHGWSEMLFGRRCQAAVGNGHGLGASLAAYQLAQLTDQRSALTLTGNGTYHVAGAREHDAGTVLGTAHCLLGVSRIAQPREGSGFGRNGQCRRMTRDAGYQGLGFASQPYGLLRLAVVVGQHGLLGAHAGPQIAGCRSAASDCTSRKSGTSRYSTANGAVRV